MFFDTKHWKVSGLTASQQTIIRKGKNVNGLEGGMYASVVFLTLAGVLIFVVALLTPPPEFFTSGAFIVPLIVGLPAFVSLMITSNAIDRRKRQYESLRTILLASADIHTLDPSYDDPLNLLWYDIGLSVFPPSERRSIFNRHADIVNAFLTNPRVLDAFADFETDLDSVEQLRLELQLRQHSREVSAKLRSVVEAEVE